LVSANLLISRKSIAFFKLPQPHCNIASSLPKRGNTPLTPLDRGELNSPLVKGVQGVVTPPLEKVSPSLSPTLVKGGEGRFPGNKVVDIKLKKFVPSLAEVPSKELEALKERTIKSGFDFIDFWAVDFDYQDGQPFEHHWQAYRTRKDRSLLTVSNHEFNRYPKKGKYMACVKVVDIFGCDTSITVEVEI